MACNPMDGTLNAFEPRRNDKAERILKRARSIAKNQIDSGGKDEATQR